MDTAAVAAQARSNLTTSEKREKVMLLETKLAFRAKKSIFEYVKFVPVPGVPIDEREDCEEFYPDKVTPAAHHLLMLDVLQNVAEGHLKRVIFMMPPGSAKSTFASVVFPPFYIGRKRQSSIIAMSYGDDLAKKFGRRCRAVVRSDEYKKVFGTTLVSNNTAADDWSLGNGSTYMCGGMLSGVTGHRADGLICDDPLKGGKEADSETIRNTVWETYKSDLRTRLKPRGWIVLVATRWHWEDLLGRILPVDYDGRSGWVTAQDGEKWYVLNFPAQCEMDDDPVGRKIGEYLWTEWFPVAHYEQEKITQGPRNWAALYQQRPSPQTGDYFLDEDFRWYENLPPKETLRFYMASDYAVTEEGKAGDWTVHGVAATDPNDNLYIVDWWRKKTKSDIWIEDGIDLAERWKPMEWAEEAGQIKKAIGPFLQKRLRERKVNVYRKQYPSVADKPTRAQSFRARMSMHRVFFPRNAPWIADLMAEMLAFPHRDVDDQVDVLGLFGRMLDRMTRGKALPKAQPKLIGMEGVTLDRLFKDHEKHRNESSRI